MPRELPIPPDAKHDENSAEVLRAWIVNEALQVAVKPSIWRDGGECGILLADVAQHVADAMALETGKDFGKTVARIREMFNRELGAPTDERSGSFLPRGREV